MGNVLQLTTLEEIQTYPGMGTVKEEDHQWIITLSEAFSHRAEQYCSRGFYTEERVQQFSSDGNTSKLQLPAFGRDTNTLTKVEQDLSRTFGVDYELDLTQIYFDWRTGILHKDYSPFLHGNGTIRVTWTGGIGTTVDDVPADLRAAAAMQVAYLWQRRNELGLEERKFERGATISISGAGRLMPDVEDVLSRYALYF